MGRNEQAVQAAAKAVLDHGGPECRTDPSTVMRAMGRALDAGATHDDIKAEMQHQRKG